MPWLFKGQTYLGWYSLMTRNTRQKFAKRWQIAEYQVSKPACRCQMTAKSTSMPHHHQHCHEPVSWPNDQNERYGDSGIQWLAAVLHCSKSELQYLWMELCPAQQQKAMHTIPSRTFWPHSSVSRICALGCLGDDSHWQQNEFSSHSFFKPRRLFWWGWPIPADNPCHNKPRQSDLAATKACKRVAPVSRWR